MCNASSIFRCSHSFSLTQIFFCHTSTMHIKRAENTVVWRCVCSLLIAFQQQSQSPIHATNTQHRANITLPFTGRHIVMHFVGDSDTDNCSTSNIGKITVSTDTIALLAVTGSNSLALLQRMDNERNRTNMKQPYMHIAYISVQTYCNSAAVHRAR